MREIPLTRGMVALVDDEDYEEVSRYRWTYHRPRHSRAGYAQTSIESAAGGWRTVRMHQMVFGPISPHSTIDHVDGDGLNNRRGNLRAASRCEQSWNRRTRIESSTGLKGVFPTTTTRWIARIGWQGKRLNLGTFDSPEKAARAYDARARELCGEFARLNFPEDQQHVSPPAGICVPA